MSTIRINATHPSQGPFVVINISDFDPAIHEPFGQDDIDTLRAAPAGELPKLVDAAGADLARRHEHLEAQAARQREESDRLDAEANRQFEQAAKLTVERERLEALAKSIEHASAEFSPGTEVDEQPGTLIDPESPEAAAALAKIEKPGKAKK